MKVINHKDKNMSEPLLSDGVANKANSKFAKSSINITSSTDSDEVTPDVNTLYEDKFVRVTSTEVRI